MSNEAIRLARNLLTVATVDELVHECLGTVRVLVIVGRTRTGKSWALQDWSQETRHAESLKIGFVNCKDMIFERPVTVSFDGAIHKTPPDVYPSRLLEPANVVIVDEPQLCPDLVNAAFEQLRRPTEGSAHHLLVLPVLNTRILGCFAIPAKAMRCYSVAGLPVMLEDAGGNRDGHVIPCG